MRVSAAVVTILLISVSAHSQKFKPHQRIYSNDVPPVQIIGLAMADNMDNAFASIESRGREQANLQLEYPTLVDAPSELIGGEGAAEPQGAKDAWDMQSEGQFSYSSRVARMYRLDRFGPVSIVLLDRQRRIRAIAVSPAVVGGISSNRYAELVEYLLLNVGGVEAIPYDVAGMSDADLRQSLDLNNPDGLYSWEHAAELQRRETGQGKSGSQLTPIYPLFGQAAPDFELPLANGTGTTSLSSLAKDKVTLLVIFWAGGGKSDFTAISQTTAAMEQLKAVDRFHINWTLKLAEPGAQEYANAQPFANTNTEVAKASTRGAFTQVAAPAGAESEPEQESTWSAEEFGKEGAEGEEGAKEQRWSVSAAVGIRNYSWKQEFDWQGLPTVNAAFGLKLDVRIWQFFVAEASVLASVKARSFAEDAKHYDAIRELMVPLSVNVVVKPKLGDGFFSPFVTIGLGPSFLSFRKRDNLNATGQIDPNNPYTEEHYFPSGIGLQKNAGIGGDFRITSKIFAGLDIRYFFLTIPKDALDPVAIKDESDEFAKKIPVEKDYKYDNATIMVYGGLKF
ncbi:MAG: hypothetical protein GF418_02625 [Chitinivibrionales bacterium]|nr:hypothetical protein [Chitinivibrionales bacterium]MBD3394497.1 hypothetical protein [Chitinivibrionales bacterium]